MEKIDKDSKDMKNLLYLVLVLLGIGLLVFVVMETRNTAREYNYIGQTSDRQNEITISGVGEVVVVPDVAKFSLGVFTESGDVGSAQKDTVNKMNKINAELKKQGVDEKDIKTTQFNIQPQYDYTDGQRNLKGYRVSQSVTVTVRDISKAGSVLAEAAKLGANNVGQLSFEVDDIETVKQEARLVALESAKEKAEEMADSLDVKLGRIINFSEDAFSPKPSFARQNFGLELAEDSAMAVPEIEPGSEEVRVTVYVSFELL